MVPAHAKSPLQRAAGDDGDAGLLRAVAAGLHPAGAQGRYARPPAVLLSIRHKLTLAVVAAALAALIVTGIALVLYDLHTYRAASARDVLTQAEILGRLVDYLGIFGAVAVLSLLVALLVSAWLQAVLTRPILAAAAVARAAVERRDFSLRLEKPDDDDLGQLADALNDLLAEIGRNARALETSNQALAREIAERRQADERSRALSADLERRVEERSARLEEANRELESFSYSVSHDLRAPVRAIVGFARMLDEDYGPELADDARRKLRVVQNEAHRMGELIDDLLAFSRLGRQDLQLTELDMAGLARATYDGLTQTGSNPLRELHLGALPRARGDRALLGQVWANLLANAVKFSSKRERPLIEVNGVSDEREHIYFVRDNGAGFDPRYQSKLFGVFQRLHSGDDFPGTGVGLALVQRIVTRHGGRVWAEGRPGEGATFYFALPRAARSAPGKAP